MDGVGGGGGRRCGVVSAVLLSVRRKNCLGFEKMKMKTKRNVPKKANELNAVVPARRVGRSREVEGRARVPVLLCLIYFTILNLKQ